MKSFSFSSLFFIGVLFFSPTFASADEGLIQSVKAYFNPLLSNDLQVVQQGRSNFIAKCSNQIVQLQINIMVLEEAQYSYYASVNRSKLGKVRSSCNKRIQLYNTRIAELSNQ